MSNSTKNMKRVLSDDNQMKPEDFDFGAFN